MENFRRKVEQTNGYSLRADFDGNVKQANNKCKRQFSLAQSNERSRCSRKNRISNGGKKSRVMNNNKYATVTKLIICMAELAERYLLYLCSLSLPFFPPSNCGKCCSCIYVRFV